MLQQARRLGLAQGRTLILDDMEEMSYVFDLAITGTARPFAGDDGIPGRRSFRRAPTRRSCSRRCARRALRSSSFGPHDATGVIATDLFRRTRIWLVDIELRPRWRRER